MSGKLRPLGLSKTQTRSPEYLQKFNPEMTVEDGHIGELSIIVNKTVFAEPVDIRKSIDLKESLQSAIFFSGEWRQAQSERVARNTRFIFLSPLLSLAIAAPPETRMPREKKGGVHNCYFF